MSSKLFKQITLCLVVGTFMVSLSGCGSSSDNAKKGETLEAVDKNDYSSLLPYQSSDAAQMHASLSTNQSESFTVGSGLMELSKDYFSPDTHTFRENTYIDYDTLDASDGSTGLLGRYNKTKNTIGVNPQIETVYPIKDGGEYTITSGDVILLDIQEYDWYEGDELKGVSLGFVFNDQFGDETNPVTMDPDKFKLFAQETTRTVVSYLRKKVPAIGNKLPIFVALYNTTTVDDSLPGAYFEKAYFKTKIDGTFESVDEQWTLFPTEIATKLDGTTATEFNTFKASFKDVMPLDVSIVGKGHYLNNALQELRINITMHARSNAEIKTAIQLVNEKLSAFSSTSYVITVDITSDSTHAGVIKRDEGSSKTTVITLI